MNFELYREIWEVKFENDSEKHQDKNVDGTILTGIASNTDVFDEPYAAFRTDLAKHKLVWTGDFRSDLWFYIKNEHPLLSICLSPKQHPLGRFERLFIELFIFSIAAMWAASVVKYTKTVETENDLVNEVAYLGYSILGGVVKIVVGGILKAAATCSCCQLEGTRMRKKWERCGYVCMTVWGAFSMGFLGLAGWFVSLNGSDYWKEWLISLCISYGCGWIFSLVITVVAFMLMFNCCKKNDYKFKFVVTYKDYLHWKEQCGDVDMHERQADSRKKSRSSPYAQVYNDDDIEVVQPIDL